MTNGNESQTPIRSSSPSSPSQIQSESSISSRSQSFEILSTPSTSPETLSTCRPVQNVTPEFVWPVDWPPLASPPQWDTENTCSLPSPLNLNRHPLLSVPPVGGPLATSSPTLTRSQPCVPSESSNFSNSSSIQVLSPSPPPISDNEAHALTPSPQLDGAGAMSSRGQSLGEPVVTTSLNVSPSECVQNYVPPRSEPLTITNSMPSLGLHPSERRSPKLVHGVRNSPSRNIENAGATRETVEKRNHDNITGCRPFRTLQSDEINSRVPQSHEIMSFSPIRNNQYEIQQVFGDRPGSHPLSILSSSPRISRSPPVSNLPSRHQRSPRLQYSRNSLLEICSMMTVSLDSSTTVQLNLSSRDRPFDNAAFEAERRQDMSSSILSLSPSSSSVQPPRSSAIQITHRQQPRSPLVRSSNENILNFRERHFADNSPRRQSEQNQAVNENNDRKLMAISNRFDNMLADVRDMLELFVGFLLI